MKYKTIEELIDMIDRPIKTKVFDIYKKFKPEMLMSSGSQHNHQAWEGGYLDHVVDTMNVARLLFQAMNDKRKLEFSLSDALVTIFFHDIEKAFPSRINELTNNTYFTRPKAKTKVRFRIIHEEQVWGYLNDAQKNALDFAEGENEHYTNERRVMGPLAAFVHMCDITSARIWFDHPAVASESWGWRESGTSGDEQLWGV